MIQIDAIRSIDDYDIEKVESIWSILEDDNKEEEAIGLNTLR